MTENLIEKRHRPSICAKGTSMIIVYFLNAVTLGRMLLPLDKIPLSAYDTTV